MGLQPLPITRLGKDGRPVLLRCSYPVAFLVGLTGSNGNMPWLTSSLSGYQPLINCPTYVWEDPHARGDPHETIDDN